MNLLAQTLEYFLIGAICVGMIGVVLFYIGLALRGQEDE
jgi:hypothetical protein